MNTTKKRLAFTLVALMGLGATTVGAQQNTAPADPPTAESPRADHARTDRGAAPTAEERIDRRIRHLDERLELTDPQEARLRREMQRAEAERQGMREARQRSREAHEARLNAILTPAQRAELAEMKEEGRGRGHGHQAHGRGHGRGHERGHGPHGECPPGR